MARHTIINIFYIFTLLAVIIDGIKGQCSASDFCCAPISGNNSWAKPVEASDAFAACYIQGADVASSDCPTGWGYQAGTGPGTGQCYNEPFQPSTFTSVKSCANSNSCSSVANVCGNPTVRTGLNLMVNCIIQGGVNITSCPKGWHRESCSKCIKNIQVGTDYNAIRTEDMTTCNPTIVPSGGSGPGETDPWTTCLQNNPEIYPSCPTPGDQPNGTDLGEKFYSDIEYAKSVLRDWPGFSPHIKCLCESKCGQYLKEVWPGNANDRLCNLYLSDGKKCTGDGCCGAGTTYKDGSCVASWGEKDACEDVGHGKHGWKCGGVSDSCEK